MIRAFRHCPIFSGCSEVCMAVPPSSTATVLSVRRRAMAFLNIRGGKTPLRLHRHCCETTVSRRESTTCLVYIQRNGSRQYIWYMDEMEYKKSFETMEPTKRGISLTCKQDAVDVAHES